MQEYKLQMLFTHRKTFRYFVSYIEMVCTPKNPSDCEEKENNGFAGFYSDEMYIYPEHVLNRKSTVISDTITPNEVKPFASDQKQANILDGFLQHLLSESGNGSNQMESKLQRWKI